MLSSLQDEASKNDNPILDTSQRLSKTKDCLRMLVQTFWTKDCIWWHHDNRASQISAQSAGLLLSVVQLELAILKPRLTEIWNVALKPATRFQSRRLSRRTSEIFFPILHKVLLNYVKSSTEHVGQMFASCASSHEIDVKLAMSTVNTEWYWDRHWEIMRNWDSRFKLIQVVNRIPAWIW